MKFIPIIFSTQMVQAILDARKTQTRRVVKEAQGFDPIWFPALTKETHLDGISRYEMRTGTEYGFPFFKCPYGQPGDILWVRETFSITGSKVIRGVEGEILDEEIEFVFKGQKQPHIEKLYKWKPSIHMPKDACRIFLQVKSVRVERLWDISEEDAKAEGAEKAYQVYKDQARYKLGFNNIWEHIYGTDSLESNPWVWVIEFDRIKKPINF